MEISVALGGGGAKGNAHIGVLRVLEREGFRVCALAGTSIGGLVGAVYAAGYSTDEMEARISAVEQSELYSRQRGDGPGLLGFAGVTRLLTSLLGDREFSDLEVPFAVTAVDLNTGQEVVLRQGRVVDAVLATLALPGIFPPQKWEGSLLVDGGVSNPVPVALARELGEKAPVIAVALNVPPSPTEEMEGLAEIAPPLVVEYISRLRLARALDLFLRSMMISISLLTEYRLQIEKPDLIIRPPVDHIGLLDRVDVHEIVELGEQAARDALPDLYRALGWRGWLSQRIPWREWLAKIKSNEP